MSKTEDYMAMAESAADKAAASPLDNVREQHERSAAVWRDLARSEHARTARRDEIVAATARRLAALDATAASGEGES